jgi:hypothetical protein
MRSARRRMGAWLQPPTGTSSQFSVTSSRVGGKPTGSLAKSSAGTLPKPLLVHRSHRRDQQLRRWCERMEHPHLPCRGWECDRGCGGLSDPTASIWATRGEGAFASGKRMRVSEVDHLGGATVCDDYRHHIERSISNHPLMRIAGHCGSIHPHEGHSMLAVSDGRADVGLGTGGGSWDYAPFVLLVEESGGRTSDVEGESRFDSGSLLASNGRLHDEVLRVLREI